MNYKALVKTAEKVHERFCTPCPLSIDSSWIVAAMENIVSDSNWQICYEIYALDQRFKYEYPELWRKIV